MAQLLGCGELCERLVSCKLVQPLCQALGGAAGVDEDDRRVVFADQLQKLWVDRRPDRADVGQGLSIGWSAVLVWESWSTWFRHVLHRDDDLQVELLRDPSIDDLAIPLGPDEKSSYPLQRPLSSRETYSLQAKRISRGWRRRGAHPRGRFSDRRGWGVPCGDRTRGPIRMVPHQMLQPLQTQRQVRPALRLRHSMNLVDDHRFDADENLAGARGEHQVERLW